MNKSKIIFNTEHTQMVMRSDHRALKLLNEIANSFQLTKQIRGRAAYLYHIMTQLIDTWLNRIIIVATAIYIAIRESPEGNPITLTELTEGFTEHGHPVSKTSVFRTLWALRPKLSNVIDFSKILSKSKDYLVTVVQKVRASKEIKKLIEKQKVDEQEYYRLLSRETRDLLQKIPSQARGGCNPYIFTVSVMYATDRIVSTLMSIRPIFTQKAIADATNVADMSIRNHCKVIRNYLPEMLFF